VAITVWLLRRGLAPVEAMAAELSRLQDRLGGALAREKEFTGHVAHELRTPLTVLHTGLELALRKQPAGTESHFQVIELLATVQEMQRLVDNLLLLARVERTAETTQLQPVDVRPLVDAVWKRFESKASGRELSFENRVPDDHRVQGDRGKLHIVIQNLLANAVSYTETRGSIVVEAAGRELLSVWDSGPQLADEQLPRVFDRLWRADLARTDATKHAGLGLSLARALCRHMGMDLAAENVASGGLRFVVSHQRAQDGAA
jgi:signal transduction histidine kinase